MKLIWTRRAADQLEAVVEAIAADHPRAAAEWAGRIVDAGGGASAPSAARPKGA
jgi:plasmid stabilization system protein ParE